MEKRTCDGFTRVLLIDDNPLTYNKLLRLFTAMECSVVHRSFEVIDPEEVFHLVLVNRTMSGDWIPRCIQYLNNKVPVISFNPAYLIRDFNSKEASFSGGFEDDAWMFRSEFFQLVRLICR